jgi:alkylation response protein AidB-like acyl-CoA dehydrogenase
MVTTRAVQVVGGRSAHRRYPLERLLRDVRTATLMPPNEDRAIEIVGQAAFDIHDDLLLARHAG